MIVFSKKFKFLKMPCSLYHFCWRDARNITSSSKNTLDFRSKSINIFSVLWYLDLGSLLPASINNFRWFHSCRTYIMYFWPIQTLEFKFIYLSYFRLNLLKTVSTKRISWGRLVVLELFMHSVQPNSFGLIIFFKRH